MVSSFQIEAAATVGSLVVGGVLASGPVAQWLGQRATGESLRAKDGVQRVWLAAVTVWLALILGTLVSRSNDGWTCPELPGCRSAGFWPGDGPAQLHMLFRLPFCCGVLLWYVAAGMALPARVPCGGDSPGSHSWVRCIC